MYVRFIYGVKPNLRAGQQKQPIHLQAFTPNPTEGRRIPDLRKSNTDFLDADCLPTSLPIYLPVYLLTSLSTYLPT